MISSVNPAIAAFQSVASAQSRALGGQESAKTANPGELTEEQQKEVERLKERDREVRAHEQAHARAGGPYASSPTYEYERGPDGRMYAVSGEVQIDASPIPGNPSATIAKMEIVIRAAMAPAEPSAQDSRVAAEARAAKIEAQVELRKEKQEEAEEAAEGLFSQEDDFGRASEAYANAEGLISDITEFALDVAA